MQKQIHLAKEVREGFRFISAERTLLKSLTFGYRLHLFGKMMKCLDEEATSAARWVENCFSKTWVGHFDHEANHWTWCIEFTRITSRITHFSEHRFVQGAKRVKFITRREMNACNLVDDIPQ